MSTFRKRRCAGPAGLRAATLATPLLASAAFAAEHGAHQAHAAPSISTLFLPVVNFVLFVAVFFRYAWPAICAALVERRKLVEKDLAEADRAQVEARARLAEIEALRSRLAADGQRLLEEMRSEAERDRRAMLESAKASAERVRTDARQLTEQEAHRAAQSIRAEIVDQVVRKVTAALQAQLTGQDEERFAERFVAALDSGAAR